MTLQGYQLACTRGERPLFKNINFEIQAGEAMRVAGSNGCGKTSLLRLLCGLACPSEGEVRWKGSNISSVREEFGAALAYLGHGNGVKDDLTAWENVVISATLSGISASRQEACDALEQIGLAAVAHLPTRALSQGQRKRVALARLRLPDVPVLWILDEPFTALDRDAVSDLCGVLDHHLSQNGMVIYTTHQEIDLQARRLLRLDLSQEAAC